MTFQGKLRIFNAKAQRKMKRRKGGRWGGADYGLVETDRGGVFFNAKAQRERVMKCCPWGR
jgi:hypothetical protein